MNVPIDTEQFCFNFGKYLGHTYQYVLIRDPFYIKWLIDQDRGFDLNDEDLRDLMNECNRVTSERGW